MGKLVEVDMAYKEEKFEDGEIYPAEASEQGCNAYYLPGCEVAGHRPAYAACLKKIADRKNGRLATSLSECSAAIGKKECQAQRMRKEELVEGRAIYFLNRNKLRSFMQYQFEMERQHWASVSLGRDDKKKATSKHRAVTQSPTAPPPIKHFLDMNTGSYADAINAALDEQALEPVEPTSLPVQHNPAPAAPIAAGMSLLEMARLMAANKASA